MTIFRAGGTSANGHGRAAEDVIEGILNRKGFAFTRQAPIGLGIFDTELRADFLVSPSIRFPEGFVVESKWQQVHGSAEEKLPYLVENIRHCYPAPAIVVIGGGGHRVGALQWLTNQVDGYKLIHVFSVEEFIAWSNRL